MRVHFHLVRGNEVVEDEEGLEACRLCCDPQRGSRLWLKMAADWQPLAESVDRNSTRPAENLAKPSQDKPPRK
jgi:hypothetical protein